jgi:acyl-CoA thioesterase-1
MKYSEGSFRNLLRMLPFVVVVTGIVLVALLNGITMSSAQQKPPRTVLFFGDSLTAGYGLSREEAFPARIGELAAHEDFPIEVINAGASGDTTAGGLRRLDWVLKERPDVVVLALGANDGLRGLDVESVKANLIEIVRRIRTKFPGVPILLLPMELPPTFGESYVRRFREVYGEVSRETSVAQGPFLLEQVAGYPNLNLPDRLHPNARGHELVAQTVWPSLKSILMSEVYATH